MLRRYAIIPTFIALAALASPAGAVGISLGGLIVNLCVLTLTTPGTLVASSDGTQMASALAGGSAATMTVVATGGNPTIAFTAPALSAPVGASSGITKEIAYTSPGGANQSYTSSSSSHASSGLLDTLTINARLTSAAGFVAGAYTLTSTATCSQ